MKKALHSAVLLLLLLLLSGSTLFLFAGPATHSQNSQPGQSGWASAIATSDALSTPTVVGQILPIAEGTPFYGLAVDRHALPPEAFPPMYFTPWSGPLKARQVTAKDFYLNIVDRSVTSSMIVKFTEESKIRWNGSAPYSKTGADVGPLRTFLANHPELTIRREMVDLQEDLLDTWERTGEQNTGQDLANLNNFYVLDIRSNPDPMSLIQDVIKLDIVETAFYKPTAVPACADLAPTTPLWVANQTYHGAAPTGVNSDFAGTYHAWGHGHPGAWTVDIEWDWTEDHEDFPSTFAVLDGGDGGSAADHGDACSGIIGACSNAYGMEGESHNVTPKGISVAINNRTCGQAVALAVTHLFAGESMFIEMHGYAVNPGYNCDTGCGNCGQFGYVAMEYWDDNFAAMQTATANGRLIYEAAGNGQCNLDATAYASRFNRNFRDSGAIVVGASHSDSQTAMCWSNYGSRVDCNGWGENVYTIGYGDLWSGGARNQYYTSSFSGTSSATPIVTAAGNDLQGVLQGKYGVTATPAQMRAWLHDNGTPYTGTHAIGNKPNLLNAINAIEPDVQPYTRGGWSSPFVPRNASDATVDGCAITALTGNSNSTWVNACGINTGVSPAPDSGSAGVPGREFLDGDVISNPTWSPRIASGGQFVHMNGGPLTVRGGRHTLQFAIDPDNAFNEVSETNNTYTQQNVWSPLNWTAQSYGERAAPPLKNFGSPTYLNGDGFRSVPSGSTYWLGCAILPQFGEDFDLYSFADTYTNASGFDTQQKYSGAGTSSPDMIIVNGNVVSPMNRLFQAVRYYDTNTSNYAVEVDQASTASWYPPYTANKTLDVNAVMDMFEIYLEAGTPYFIGAVDVTGGLDVTLSIYGQGGDYYAVGDYAWTSNVNGANGNEFLNITPTTAGWYVAVVMKANSNSYGLTGAYTFDFYSNPVSNLVPGVGHPGWDAAMVARNTNDASQNNTHFPAAVTGNAVNFLNSAWYNAGFATVPSGVRISAKVDNVWVGAITTPVGLPSVSYTEAMPMAVTMIRGGRHTMTLTLDSSNVVAESNETDNEWSGQYVWSPLSLTRGTSVQRMAPPVEGNGTYPNSDGFSMPNPGSYASVAALLPRTATADYDMYLYSDYTSSFSGFSALMTSSAYGSGSMDYVLVPWRTNTTQSAWYPAVTNWNSASDSVLVQYENSVGHEISTYPFQIANPDTIPNRGLTNVYEVYLTTGYEYTFTCDMLQGNANIDMRLYRDSTAFQYRGYPLVVADANGSGGDEVMTYYPPVTDWYAIVVSKVSTVDAALHAIYNFSASRQAGSHTPLTPSTLVVQPWTNSNSVRLAWTHVTQDSLGSPLTGRRYVIYRSAGVGIVPLPTDSIGGTTDSTFIDANATGLMNFYKVKVKAN